MKPQAAKQRCNLGTGVDRGLAGPEKVAEEEELSYDRVTVECTGL